jgi:hypothetical protein
MAAPKKNTTAVLFLICCLGLANPSPAGACSCAWKGPFFIAAQDAPLVVIGKILRHHPGESPTMDVLVSETLKGGLLDSGLVVQMGDGMHCRPSIDLFPVGTSWVLAINGQGAKPGNGLAISHCGEYWLRVEDNQVIGSIDGKIDQIKRIPLQEFKNRFLYPRFNEEISGRVETGKQFRRPFGQRFEFILEPTQNGWEILIREYGRDENLSRLTPPFHFVPNPREIEGWHLLKDPSACGNRPFNADAGPENPRKFIFSPDVGRKISYRPETLSADVKEVANFGRGVLIQLCDQNDLNIQSQPVSD